MQSAQSIRISSFSLCVLAAPAAAQSVVHYLPDGGATVVRAGDFDLDGVGDFAERSSAGVRVRSGVDASVLRFIDTSGLSGTALAICGDLDHDGALDLVVGDPSAIHPSGLSLGRAIAYSGATGLELWTTWGTANSDSFGFTVGEAGDANGDGTPDVLACAWQYNPPNSGPGAARLLSGIDGSILREWVGAFPGAATFGIGLDAFGDLDGDGHDDQLVSELSLNGGVVYVYSGADGSTLKVIDPPVDGAFGFGIDGSRDLDGDGVRDVAGTAAAWNSWSGRAAVVSGADSSVLVDVKGTLPFGTYLGQDVAFLDDVNGDGVPEMVTCGLAWPSLPNAQGFALVVSGADSSILIETAIPGISLGTFGSTVCGLDDFDGDGLSEFAVGSGGTIVFSSQTDPPVTYCPAKINSQGCTPAGAWSGTASLTGPADFHLSCTGMLNGMRGALMWSAAASAPPYQGGVLCLAAPWQPAASFSTGGSPSGVDCSGSANAHLTQAFLASAGALPGATLYAQFFYRDPFHPDGSGLGLSDGMSFEVLP